MELPSIDYVKFYKLMGFELKDIKDTEAIGHCPLHDDKSASFAFHTEKGLWRCFAGCGDGNVFQFLEKKYKVCPSDAEDIFTALKKPITEDIKIYHENLINHVKVYEAFIKKRSLTKDVIKKYLIGWNGERYTIPIVVGNVLCNIRKYSLESKTTKMLNMEGYGNVKLYPYENLWKGTEVHIMEGELDALLATQLGLNAVSVTSGAGTWKKEWNMLFRGKEVYICYDVDKAGQRGAEAIASQLRNFAKLVHIVNLPITDIKGGDFTDYIQKGNTVAMYRELMKEPDPIDVLEPIEEKDPSKEKAVKTTLKEASSEDFYFKKIALPVVISGKDLTPFLIPKKVRAVCTSLSSDSRTMKKCIGCMLSRSNKERIVYINQYSHIALKLIYSSDSQVTGFLKEQMGIPQNCHSYKVEIQETQNVEEVRAIPEIEYSATDGEYVARTIYHLGKNLKTNASYTVTGVAMPHPKNQYATILFDKADPKQTDLDVFKMNEQSNQILKIFQPAKGQSVAEKIAEINRDITYNVTKIYGREDLLTAIRLVFNSVLEFEFLGTNVRKGYTEGLVLGDTRCGKTATIQAMVEYHRAGEFMTGENSSYSGLVGGMSQVGNKWQITWGKLPLNDRRLVVIDEASSLTEETISQLSALRSSGIAEIVKIQTERTPARCRMLWISNPRSGRKLNTYNHGILAVKELIGKVEDIARFDFCITVASEDVDLSHIQKDALTRVAHIYSSELSNLLLMWCWSRHKSHIKFTDDAIDAVLQYTNQVSEMYSSAIPLVEPAEMRIKIARMAVACAASLFSTDDGENVIVGIEHVDFVAEFLKQIYNKPSMGYNLFSQSQFLKTRIDADHKAQVIKEFKEQFNNWDLMRDVLLEAQYFRKTEFLDQTDMTKDEARIFFRWCSKHRLLKSSPAGYIKSPIFTEVLKEIIDDVKPAEEADGKEGDF